MSGDLLPSGLSRERLQEELKYEGDSTRCELHGETEALGGEFTLGTTVTVTEKDEGSLVLSIENDDEPVVEE